MQRQRGQGILVSHDTKFGLCPPGDSWPVTHLVWEPKLVPGAAERELPFQGISIQAHTAIVLFSVIFPGLDASSSLLGQRAKNQQVEQVSFHLYVSSLHLKLRYNLSSPNDGNWGKSSLRAAQPYWSNWLFA